MNYLTVVFKHWFNKYNAFRKCRPHIFYDNFGKCRPFLYFFTVKFRGELRKKLDLKLPTPHESVSALPFWKVSLQRIHISKNNLLDVRRHLFREFFLFPCLVFLPDADIIVITMRYFVITHAFNYYKGKRVAQHWSNKAQSTHPLISGVRNSKRICILAEYGHIKQIL